MIAASGPLIVLLLWAVTQTFFFTAEGALATHVPSAWGDWPLHSAHAWWFAEQPPERWRDIRLLRYDSAFTYPPLINFLSGMLIRSGIGFYASMMIPFGLFAIAIAFGLLRLYFLVSKTIYSSGTDGAGGVMKSGLLDFLAGLLFALTVLLGGGTRIFAGVIEYLVKPLHSKGALWDAVLQATKGGVLEGPLKQAWLTPLFTQLLPQRTFMAGMAIGITAVCVLLRQGHRHWFLALLLPMLAFAHTYSWIAVMLLVAVMIFLDIFAAPRSASNHLLSCIRKWFLIVGPGVTLSLGVFLIFLPGVAAKSSGFGWSPGWMASDAGQNVISFWLVNWGVFLPLVIIAASTSRAVRIHPLFITGILLFVFMNTVKLQPWAWDNSKFLLWSMLMMGAPVSAWMVRDVMCTGMMATESRMRAGVRFMLVSLVAGLLLVDGFMFIVRRLNKPDLPLELWSTSEQVIATWAREKLPKNALILSPSPEDHRYWAFALTGRQNVQAYGGWIWTHGLSLEPMQSTIRNMLEYPEANLPAIHSTGVTHIAVPDNGGRWKIDHAALEKHFKLLIGQGNQQVLAVH
jgi:hypothetical protein